MALSSEKNLSSFLQQQIQNLQQILASKQQVQAVSQPSAQAKQAPTAQLSQLLQSVTQSVEVSQPQIPAQVSQRLQTVTQSVEGMPQKVPASQSVRQNQIVIPKEPSYQYKVRIINPAKKSDVKVRLIHNVASKFKSVKALKEVLMEQLKELVPDTTNFEVGFMEGNQQARIWLATKEDLLSMYQVYKNGGNITLWCDSSNESLVSSGSGQGSKRKRDDESTGTRRQAKEEEVDNVFKELRKKHTDIESTKLRLWARMICGGLHDSYDEPPDIPAFNSNRKRPRRESLSDALSGAATAIYKVLSPTSAVGESNTPHSTLAVSPSKAVNLRMKSYEQLRYLKKLHEDGILEEKEYTEQKGNIMMTLRKLN